MSEKSHWLLSTVAIASKSFTKKSLFEPRQDVTFFTFQISSDPKLQKDVTQSFKGLGDIAYRLSPIAPFDRPPPSFAPNSPLIRLRIEVSSSEERMRLTTAFGLSGPQDAPFAK